MEKKCNCSEPYDAEYFQGGHPYCPIHDARQTNNDAQDQIIANQVAGMPREEAIFQTGYSSGYNNGYERGKREAAPAGAAWVKASERLPEHNVGVIVFIPGEDNHITSGMWDISNEWVLLDEYRTPDEEVTHWTALPAFPEGYTNDDIPEEWVSTLKAIAKEELAKKGIAKADTWISVDDQLPEIGEYVMVYNTERARLIGRLMSNGWVAMFWDGEKLMGELTATHWRELPAGPKK